MAVWSRFLEPTLRRALATFPVVLVTGARQTGKTTLLRERLRGSHAYVSLERPDVRARALADPVAFLREAGSPLVLDEIQHAPALLHFVKDAVDEDRRPGRWVLTGSQTFSLMQGVTQTLAGRVATLVLDPFSRAEAARGRPRTVDAHLAEVFGGGPSWAGASGASARRRPARSARTGPTLGDWLLRGGYPELRARPSVDRKLWVASYVQTYLERDVRDLLRVGNLHAFNRFLALVAARNGTLLNLADLGRDLGVTAPTIRAWLGVLEASGIVFLLRPHHENLGKRLVKSPKLYVLDPALVTFLTGLHSAEAAQQGPLAGALVESVVVAEWVKAFRQNGEPPSLYFWRTSAGEEIDLLIERDGRLYAVEVKATATPNPGHAAGLARWLERVGERGRAVLACDVPAPLTIRPSIRAVPIFLG